MSCRHIGHNGSASRSILNAHLEQQTRCPQGIKAAFLLFLKHTTHSCPSPISSSSLESSSWMASSASSNNCCACLASLRSLILAKLLHHYQAQLINTKGCIRCHCSFEKKGRHCLKGCMPKWRAKSLKLINVTVSHIFSNNENATSDRSRQELPSISVLCFNSEFRTNTCKWHGPLSKLIMFQEQY
jgi:hypothetical protein